MAARIDFTSQRLFVEADLAPGATVALGRDQAHYLLGVLRFKEGDPLLLFNGRDGEWRAELGLANRRAAALAVIERTRPQPGPSPLLYGFAPLKHARLDYLVQKAVEMGAGVLQPILTQHTQAVRLNVARMRANMIEAAEQCGVLAVPVLRPALRFADWLADWPPDAPLVYCDEDADGAALAPLLALAGRPDALGVLIGPEGGFAAAERAALLARPSVLRLSLGPRILRADTAAVAALALVQATLGDWAAPPP